MKNKILLIQKNTKFWIFIRDIWYQNNKGGSINMAEISDPYVVQKYGRHVTLNRDNIKDIYFLTACNTACFYTEIEEYLKKEVKEETILEWNDIYVNDYLDKIEELLKKDGLDIIRTICWHFESAMSIYTKKKTTYIRIISLLKNMYEKYGYFMNYSFLDVNPDTTIMGPFNIYISMQWERDRIFRSHQHGSINHYLKDLDYVGLIPCLYYLNYMDLFWKCMDELILPIYKHFQEESKYLTDNNLKYFDSFCNVDDYSMKILIDNFIKENNITK